MNLNPKHQLNRIESKIFSVRNIILRSNMNFLMASSIVKIYLIPTLEYMMQFYYIPKYKFMKWQSIIRTTCLRVGGHAARRTLCTPAFLLASNIPRLSDKCAACIITETLVKMNADNCQAGVTL